MTLKKTILCVDEESSLSIVRLMLETRGYRVLACSSAGDALHHAGHNPVDLVLAALDVPGCDSSDLVHSLRAIAPQLPVILLGDRRRTLQSDAPADLLLRKDGYAPAELLEHIRQLLTRRRGPRRSLPEIRSSARAC
jgi:DNA-binding response OmpR family regulator